MPIKGVPGHNAYLRFQGQTPQTEVSAENEEAVKFKSESLGIVTTKKSDIRAQAKQNSSAEPKTKELLDEATRVLEEFGLKLDENQQQLCSFLDDKVSELEEKKWMFYERRGSVQDLLTGIFKNILKAKDTVNTAAPAIPPAAIACAGVTVCLV